MAPLFEGDAGPFEGSDDDEVVFGTYRRTGSWSPELVDLIAGELLLGGGGTLIDVGANLGLISIPVAHASQARCIAFEPAPDNVEYLRHNVGRHGLEDRVTIHPIALSDHDGEAKLNLSRTNSGDHRLALGPAERSRRDGPEVEVATARLDDRICLDACRRPVIMKVDTQGAELRVLHGAARSLSKVDFLIIEYWPAGLLRMGDQVDALHEALREFSHGVVLNPARAPGALRPIDEVLASLSWIARDGSDEGFFDLLLGRGPSLPSA